MKLTNTTPIALAALMCALFSTAAAANVVWPELYYQAHYWKPYSIPFIALGLAIETTAIRLWFRQSWRHAALLGLAMNLASSAIGILFIPLGGLVFTILVDIISGSGTFSAAGWIGCLVFVALVNTAAELTALFLLTRRKIKFGRRNFLILYAANLLSSAPIVWLAITRRISM